MREKHLPFAVDQQLSLAESGRGTDYLEQEEALAFFDYCKNNNHNITWLETWVLAESGRWRLEPDFSMIDYFNRGYSSQDLMKLCEDRLAVSISSGLCCRYIFWT